MGKVKQKTKTIYKKAMLNVELTRARRIKLNKGKVDVGFDADFVVVNNNFNAINTTIGGEIYK